jgi:hypothetical protein
MDCCNVSREKKRLLMLILFLLCYIQSPADRCKKIHAGDEVIQVNHQTVVCIITSRAGGDAKGETRELDTRVYTRPLKNLFKMNN